MSSFIFDDSAVFDDTTETALVLANNHGGDGQRVGQILQPGPGFTTINDAAKRGIWPDSRIRKDQAMASGTSLHYAVLIEDADGNEHLASRPGNLLSPDYLLVTNSQIKDMAHQVAALTGYDFEPVRERFTLGRKGGASYEYLMVSPDFRQDVTEGDTVRLGIRALNSYDKTTRARVEAFAERLVCLNGMIVPDQLFSFTFEHKVSSNGGRAQWEQELQRAGYQLRHLGTRFDGFVETLRRLRDVPVGTPELERFTNALPVTFPATTYGEIVRRFLGHEDKTAFGLLNACTNVTWHRGETMTDADMKRNADLVGMLTRGQLILN